MTNSYTWVQWNAHKRLYDLVLVVGSILYLVVFVGVSSLVYRDEHALSGMVLLIRGFSTLALVLLHIILCIGPLARITTRVAPILYNRRHLGVCMFLAALAHSILVLIYYGGFGHREPLHAVVDGYQSFGSISGFPFEVLGLAALLILFVMAATSHDFWLAFLSARNWKQLHMLVYVAYVLILLHVFFGALQSEHHPIYGTLLTIGAGVVASLHLTTGIYESRRDRNKITHDSGWVAIGEIDEFEHGCGRVVCLENHERIAVFRTHAGLSAMSNVCAHQGGPLGEGRVLDGCVTCPWHGYQYLPENGQSPPPFHEKIPTYELRIEGTRVLLNPLANAPGTPVNPAKVPDDQEGTR